jgi:hypothetical protein
MREYLDFNSSLYFSQAPMMEYGFIGEEHLNRRRCDWNLRREVNRMEPFEAYLTPFRNQEGPALKHPDERLQMK